MTTELGPSTVQFIKRFRFWEDPGHLDRHTLNLSDPFGYMERLESLTLHCLSVSLGQIFLILNLDMVRPLLRTLIVRLPEDEPGNIWHNLLLVIVEGRASGGGAIRVVVSSEERVPIYTDAFDSFVQEVEVIVRKAGVGEDRPWMVWKD